MEVRHQRHVLTMTSQYGVIG